jgi:hypothetical protein
MRIVSSAVLKYWRGQYPLGKTFVDFFFGLLLAPYLIGWAVLQFTASASFQASRAIYFSAIFICAVFAIVGVWRSANMHTGARGWRYAARVFSVGRVLSLFQFVTDSRGLIGMIEVVRGVFQ